MKMSSLRTIIFILVIILFVGLFYSIVKPYNIFGATIEGVTGQNEFDNMFNTEINNFCRNVQAGIEHLTKTGKMAEYNSQFERYMTTITSSNIFNNFNIVTDPNAACFANFFGIFNDSNKKIISAVIDKIVSILKDIKYTYLQTPDNSAQTSASNNASNETTFMQTVSGSGSRA